VVSPDAIALPAKLNAVMLTVGAVPSYDHSNWVAALLPFPATSFAPFTGISIVVFPSELGTKEAL